MSDLNEDKMKAEIQEAEKKADVTIACHKWEWSTNENQLKSK